MNEYDLIDVTDGEETYINMRTGETLGSLDDCFVTQATVADRLETSTDLATTSDHSIVCAHFRWDKGEGVTESRKITGWDIDGLKSKEEEQICKQAQKHQ